VAYPVKPFGFERVQGDLPLLLSAGKGERMGKQPGLLEKPSGRLADAFE
jgi:hypothetical protein